MKKTVREIIEMIDNKELFYDQTTQRNFVYNDYKVEVGTDGSITRAGNVIRSILKEKIKLPAVFFWDKGNGTYNIHDGKQRILSIYYFCKYPNADIPVTTRLFTSTDETFETLTSEQTEELLNYEFDIVVNKGDVLLEEKSFDLINKNGMPLTSYECIRGMLYGTWFEDFENKLIDYGRVYDGIPNKIGRGEEAILFLLEYFKILTRKEWNNQQKEESLRDQIRALRTNKECDFDLFNFSKKLEVFAKIFKTFSKSKSKKKTLICLEIAHLIVENNWYPQKAVIFYEEGLSKNNDISDWTFDIHKTALENLYKFDRYVSFQRYFPKDIKNLLYRTCGCCAVKNCGEEDFDKLEVDHIIPWSKGGETNIKNAQLLCKEHNAAKGDKNNEEFLKSLLKK